MKKYLFPILILIATMFMGLGYASINTISLGIDGEVVSKEVDGIFLTEVNYVGDVNADLEKSKILNAYQTNLNSNIVLSDVDNNSSITYEVVVYNSSNYNYAFEGVEYLISEDTYSNVDIAFKLSNLERGDVLHSKESLLFTITFYYKNNVLADSNVLKSLLNFKFDYVTSPVLATHMVPVVYEDNAWIKVDKYSDNWHSYLNGKWANSITYNNSLAYNEVENNTELKQFNGTSDYFILGRKNYNFASNFTIMARFKIYEYGDSTQIAVGNVESGGFYLGLGANNKIRFRHTDTSNTTSTNQNLYSSEVISLDTWYTVVVTYDGSLFNLYINGILEDSLEYANGISVSTAPLVIGGNPSADGTVTISYFKGAISEVAIMTESISEDENIQNYSYTRNHVPTRHEVLYYLKFDADNGIVSNSSKYESEGMSFDGVDDYISVGYSAYDFDNTFTIGARVKVNSYSDLEYSIFGNPQTGGLNLFKNVDSQFVIAVYDVTTNSYVNLETSFVPELYTWYTLVATYDGQFLRLYVDGVQDGYLETQITMLSVTTPFMIGVNSNLNSKLGGGYFNGLISDAILVDETLNEEQISLNYSSYFGTSVSDKTLILYNLRSYEVRDNGNVILDEMINAMWVWIPRFSAVTPISNGKIDVEIVKSFDKSHDAFNFSGQDVEGFWIGKFENSSKISYTSFVTNNNLNSNILIKSGNGVLLNRSIGKFFSDINKISLVTDIYGLDSSLYNILDTHLIKNSEWGALAYFSQSKYGLCIDENCKYLEVSDLNYFVDGIGYISNTSQSTTSNVYGVYGMYGGAEEFVMGNYNNSLNTLDGFSVLPNSIYLNAYTTEDDYLMNDLQHAFIETNSLYDSSLGNFVNIDNPWFVRNNLFSYDSNTGKKNESIGSRTVLVISE